MAREDEYRASDILPVPRTREEARQAYDRLSRIYDYTIGAFGRKYSAMALRRLSVTDGERVLEIGFGTGHCLQLMAELVGQTGRVCGIDLSSRMIGRTRRRLDRAGLAGRVSLCCGDVAHLPLAGNAFDAVLACFVLEVLDTPEIPVVLEEISRVLKPGGRLGVASMSKENGESAPVRLYEWVHNRWPKYVGSRPIYAEQWLLDAGYGIRSKEKFRVCRLPGEIIVGVKAVSGSTI